MLVIRLPARRIGYLLERGLTMALIDEFQIGFAPNERAFFGKSFFE